MKRIFDLSVSDVLSMTAQDLIKTIKHSEGRTILAETVVTVRSPIAPITTSELLAANACDIICLNVFDVNNPKIEGLDIPSKELIPFLKKNTGCFFGCNLEPAVANLESFAEGRKASAENAKKAKDLGLDFLMITGNPGTGVSMDGIINAVKEIKAVVGNDVMLIAGKMHDAGSYDYVTKKQVVQLRKAGADVFMTSAPGTTPFQTVEKVRDLFLLAKEEGMLTKAAIGTTQETSPIEIIRQIGLMAKMAGADILHIGDAGFGGIAPLENVWNLSLTVRGTTHSYRKIANRRI
ncbi:MAG: hypothetical protein ACRCVW_02390 [Brevinema sp.]